VEVIVGSKDIGGDDRGEVASVLLVVSAVHDIDHALGVRVTVVGVVRRTLMNHGLVNGVRGLVRENAGRQARNDLLDTKLLGVVQDVVVDEQVVAEVVEISSHVAEETANLGS